MRLLLCSLLLLLTTGSANAADLTFLVTGAVKGHVCWGFGIEVCRDYPIDGVKAKDGNIYPINSEFAAVDEHNERAKLCWIRTKSKGAGWLSLGINAVRQPIFVTKTESGLYKELDVEHLVFKCVKR